MARRSDRGLGLPGLGRRPVHVVPGDRAPLPEPGQPLLFAGGEIGTGPGGLVLFAGRGQSRLGSLNTGLRLPFAAQVERVGQQRVEAYQHLPACTASPTSHATRRACAGTGAEMA